MKKALFFLLLLPFSYTNAGHSDSHPAIDIIVFDFGGVVGHTDYDVFTKKVKKELGISRSQAKTLITKARKTKDKKKPAFWEMYQTKSGRDLPLDWQSQFDKMKRDSLRIKPDIEKIIAELKKHGYQVAMLSNVTPDRAKSIRNLGLYDPFKPAVLSCEINASKPHKKAFKILLKKLGKVSAERCFFIDDKKENIKAAIRLGFHAVQYKSPEKLRWELALRNILPPTETYDE